MDKAGLGEVVKLDNEIVLFETEDKQITLSVPVSGETVWLTQDRMSELFDTAGGNGNDDYGCTN